MNNRFLIILYLLLLININSVYGTFLYGQEKCGLYSFIKIIYPDVAKKISCSTIETRIGDPLWLNFSFCEKIMLVDWKNIGYNDGSQLPNIERVSLKLPTYQILDDNVVVIDVNRSFRILTYTSYFQCTINRTVEHLILDIQVFSSDHFKNNTTPTPPSQPTNNCTFKDWDCSDWYPEICPESEKQNRTCILYNINCLNPEAVKPIENRNCNIQHPTPTGEKPILNCNVPFACVNGEINVIGISIGIVSITLLPISIYFYKKFKKRKKKK